MASPSASAAAHHATPEYRNWLSLGHALTTVLCRGLRPFITRELQSFYNNIAATVATIHAAPCICVHVPRRRPNAYHDMGTCAWANILQGRHLGHRPNWKQSDSTKWMDPNRGPWEIAKLFLPDLGGHTHIQSADDMDITGILNLMHWCDHFAVQRPLIKDVRELRNTKWVHVPKLELSEPDKKDAFDAIERLLRDPKLIHDPDAQEALKEIVNLKCVSDLHNFEAQVFSHWKEVIHKEISHVKSEQRKDSQRNAKQRSRLEARLRKMQTTLEDVDKQMKAWRNVTSFTLSTVAFVLSAVIEGSKGIRGRAAATWLITLLFCCCISDLDHSSYKDGCPEEDISVPIDTREFNLTDYLTTARENFIGRQWLYREIENEFNPESDISGVLIIGDPGTGKSALSAQLVCSRTSSPSIHSHILGYHLCKYSDKNTQIAGKFVRNLVEMIARRLPEYGYLVSNGSYIRRLLDKDCIQDPVGCFEQAIMMPLRNLKNRPEENWYIVVDALDECLPRSETSHSIVYLLNNKLPRFPPWLKLVLTSRNETRVSLHSSSIKEFIINPEDHRNLDDIELFLETIFYRDEPLLHSVKMLFGDDSVKNTARLISVLLSKSQGNFLFVKEMLHHWEISRQYQSDPYALPKTLGDLYHSYFERLYDRKETFTPVRRVLELLVATFEPLNQNKIFDLLKTKEPTLDEDYDFKERMEGLKHFLKYGENGTVTLYHLSLTEWLTSESNRAFYVSKKKGHEVFCDYYFSLIGRGDKSALLRHVLHLAQHIASGGWKETYVQEFLKFPSQTINSTDPQSNRTLLHLAATINSTDVLDLILRHFSGIDCVDNRGITPAFLAAENGLVDNLALFVKRGANVNRKTNSLISYHEAKVKDALVRKTNNHIQNIFPYLYLPVVEAKSNFWDATMLHAAAQGGHLQVVRFLLNNSASISTVNGFHLTALQLAAKNGHVEVVKTLYEAGALVDQTALHHAAANNRLEVVKYLLETGVKDKCLRCDGSFYWLDKKYRLQRKIVVHRFFVVFPIKDSCEHEQQTDNLSLREECIDWDAVEEHGVLDGELFDDWHLILCETALHAAVKSGYKEVVTELLSRVTNALVCHDYTGKTPLHEAIRKNDTKIMEILFEKSQVSIHSRCHHWQQIQNAEDALNTDEKLSIEESVAYYQDICHCGYTPLHLAARYGHTDIGIDLLVKGARVDSQDCNGASPLHVAACHNHHDFVHILTHSRFGGDINSRTLNGSTPLHSASTCGAFEVIDYLLHFGANINAVDKDGLTALHYAILNINSSQLDQKVCIKDSSLNGSLRPITIDRRGNLAKYFVDKNKITVQHTNGYRWLDTFIKCAISGFDIDATDRQGRTALHIAAANGLADAVNFILLRKAKLETRDTFGKTPLEVAVENATVVPKPPPFFRHERFDDLHQALRDHEMVVYLLLSSGASFQKCNRSESSLLHRAITNRQPYSAQLLLFKGSSLTCKDKLGRTPLVTYLHNGGQWTDVVLKDFNVPVPIKCGKPFNLSVFHLLSYQSPTLEDNNFFEEQKCDDHKCKVQKGPLMEAIETHHLKYKVINKCLDAEGFTPLHRAAQGANKVAVRSLLANGANASILSPQGHDALALAVLHAGSNLWRLFGQFDGSGIFLRIGEASEVALQLLHHQMKSRGYQIKCDSSKTELTVYHLAASRGLVGFIEQLLNESESHQLNVDCPNKDGITPMYLAKVFGNQVRHGIYNPWEHVVGIIESHGGRLRYPNRDAELNVIYNRLYGWISEDLHLNLRPDVRGFTLGVMNAFKNTLSHGCPLYYTELEIVEVGKPASTRRIQKEMLRQISSLNRRMCYPFILSSWLKGMKRCAGINYFSKVTTVSSAAMYLKILTLAKKNGRFERLLHWLQKFMFHLMRLWHTEVFKKFACLKTIYCTYQPYLLDENKLRQLIQQYEDTSPTWYLYKICFRFQTAFQSYLLNALKNVTSINRLNNIFRFPDFIKDRMGWSSNQEGTHRGSWPFDFVIKFVLGLYRQYDYLKVLNVGHESKTHIALYSDITREFIGGN